jgi:hypothetical protein
MEEWLSLQGDVARLHFKFTYTGKQWHQRTGQEVPAMFVDYALSNLVTYTGPSPWANAPLTRPAVPLLPKMSVFDHFRPALTLRGELRANCLGPLFRRNTLTTAPTSSVPNHTHTT